MNDQDILARCRAGDPDAFADIVRKYQADVLAIAWSVLGQQEEARDAAQEAFIQCYQNLHRFDPGRNFKNWLCAITYKRSADRRRKLVSFRRALGRLGSAPVIDRIPEPETADKRPNTLSPYLRRLGVRERTVVLLKINTDHSFREIAEILGGSEGAARVHFFNAKRKLKKWMERTSHVPAL